MMASIEQQAKYLKHVPITNDDKKVLETIREKGLEGFHLRKQYEEMIANEERPLILRLPNEVGCNVQIADTVTLVGQNGKLLAVLNVDDKWNGLREKEVEQRFGSADATTPEAKAVLEGGDIFFGGRVTFL